MIKRVIRLLKEEGELDSNLLFSLINGLPTEHVQKEWMESHKLADVVEELSKKSEQEKISLDKTYVQMSKKVKRLYGRPVEDPEVKEMVESYMEATFSFLGEDLMKMLANVKVEELDIQELEKMTPSLFTDDVQEWLLQAIEYYMKQSEMK